MTSHTLKRGVSALGISLAIAVAGMAPASFAQSQPLPANPQPQAQPAQPNGQPSPYGYTHRNVQPGERIDRRLAFLHQQLGITPAQEAAWTDFATQLRNTATTAERDRGVRTAERTPVSAVEQLELRQRMLEKRSADLDRVLHALRPLYASFSDAQKQVADRLMVRAVGQPGNFRGPGERNGEARPGF